MSEETSTLERTIEDNPTIETDLIDDDDQDIKTEINARLDSFFSETNEEVKSESEDIVNNENYYKRIIDFKNSFKKNHSPKEYDTEDDIAKSLLRDLRDMIRTELDSKQKNRNKLTLWLVIAFSIIGVFVVVLTFTSMFYDTKIVLAVVSGFFVNTIGLVLVLLKYMFSPSKELYDYSLGIFKRKNGD